MLDPLTSLSVAGSAVQFVDFSAKLLRTIRDLYTSQSGELDELKRLKNDSDTLQRISEYLQSALKPAEIKRNLTPLEAEVVSNAKCCKDAASELTKTLNLFILPGKVKRKEWDAICLAIKAVWAEKDLERLQQRLDASRQALLTSIVANLQLV